MAHPVRRFSKKLIIFLNVVTAIFFLLGCFGYLFNPSPFWYMGLVTMGAFYLLLLLISFIFFWLLVKPRYALISLISILLAWQPLQELVKIRLDDHFTFKKNNDGLRVMSWNVEHFKIAEHKKHPERKQQMLKLINTYQPDVACFQEMVASDYNPAAINYLPDFATALNMPYYYYCYNRKLSYDKDHDFGLIIFSKYPLINKTTVSYPPKDYNSIFQYTDLVKDSDTFRIFNLHLQSLKFSDADRQYLEEPSIDEKSNFKQSRNILSKFKSGILKRQVQSERIKASVNLSPYPVVVCGDFNDVPNSYAYATIGKGLKNAFAEKGSGIGRTYSHIAPTLKIDNIFADQNFTISQYTRDGKNISDHFPIIADLFYNKQ